MTRHTIGRNPDNDIVIKHASVSRRHAELEAVGNRRYRLTDLDSSSGTFVFRGGSWEQKTNWDDVAMGDRVRFGEYETSVLTLMEPENVTQAPDRGVGGPAPTGAETVRTPSSDTHGGLPSQPSRQTSVRLIITIVAAVALGFAINWLFKLI